MQFLCSPQGKIVVDRYIVSVEKTPSLHMPMMAGIEERFGRHWPKMELFRHVAPTTPGNQFCQLCLQPLQGR